MKNDEAHQHYTVKTNVFFSIGIREWVWVNDEFLTRQFSYVSAAITIESCEI